MTYPTIKSWYAHVDSLATPAQLTAASDVLRRGERHIAGIHNFHMTGDMGQAMSALKKRGVILNCSPGRDGIYRPNPVLTDAEQAYVNGQRAERARQMDLQRAKQETGI